MDHPDQPSNSSSPASRRGDHPTVLKAGHRSGKGPRKRVLALGSVAVLAIYAAGFLRTLSAAHRFEVEGRKRLAAPERVAAPHAETVVPKVQSGTLPVVASPAVENLPSSTTPASEVLPVKEIAPAFDAAPAPVAAVVVPPTPAPASPVAAIPSPAPVASPALDGAAAQPAVAAAKPGAPARLPYKDGTFSGWGNCRHGDLEATITIKDGRIVEASISQCRTRYSQDVIVTLPPQVVARQSADVDAIAGATQSSDAFYYAVTEALRLAK